MKHSLKEQIDGITRAHKLIDNNISNQKWVLSALNDAASTIAAINLNPNIFERVKALEEVLTEIYLHAKTIGDFERAEQSEFNKVGLTHYKDLFVKCLLKSKQLLNIVP